MTKVASLSDVAAAWQDIARCEAGQLVIDWLVAKHGFSRSSTLDRDPLVMAHNEGRRTVAVDIGTMLDMDVEQLKEVERGNHQLTNPVVDRSPGHAGYVPHPGDDLPGPDDD